MAVLLPRGVGGDQLRVSLIHPTALLWTRKADCLLPIVTMAGFRYSTRTVISLTNGTQFGEPSGIFIDVNDTIYVADANSDDPGRESEWSEGVRIGSAKDGVVTTFIEDPDENGSQEGVAVDMNGVVYTSLTRDEALRRYDMN